jgi:NAD-dependent dihydropyrimidine dehydrogenase PreA subunit
MPVRDMVEIDEELCDGCGDCVTACAEGAIQIIDGKARLISDIYCDGLGACLGHCPQGAITVTRREADDFDEEAVKKHLAGLAASGGASAGGMELPLAGHQAQAPACPGSRTLSWSQPEADAPAPAHTPSRLRQWPIQLHLVPPTAPFFKDADLLLAADCVAFAAGGFHGRFLDGKALAIACPKLDSHQEIYVQKLASMIDHGGIRSLEVLVMEVPCCRGLAQLVQQARAVAEREVPARLLVVGVQGEVMGELAF